MQAIEGNVTLVQESRFQLTDDDGVSRLFILSPGAGAEPSQLGALQQRQARVRVSFVPSPHLIANTAKRVELCA